MPFEGAWKDAVGEPEQSGAWIIWGHSGNGKTRFTLQLCKYLSQFSRVLYNTLEEGARRSFQIAINASNMREVGSRMLILDKESIDDLRIRLDRKKSPNIVIIDSIQYAHITKREYIDLKETYSNKLFIFISHAEGRHPEGRLAKSVRYDADVKIHIQSYVANPVSRYGGGTPYVIWEEGARNAGMI